MLRLSAALVTFAVLFGVAMQAQAGVVVSIDQAAQRLTVSVDGMQRYEWPVSTACWGYRLSLIHI